jgi:tetratricopeptide (TPR) repeat protein
LIFSKNSTSWGIFFYDSTEDALRVTIKQQPMDKEVEWLKYEFINQTPNSATIALEWEYMMFPFKVEADINKIQIESFRRELKSSKGFQWEAWAQAAEWCADNNYDLEDGLAWADNAISGVFVGDKNFRTLSDKARILNLMGKDAEADAIMQEAMPLGTVNEVHAYARQLLTSKRYKDAAMVFRANYKKFPNQFTTNVGMVRCLSSEGNYKEALKYAGIALSQAPDMLNKTSLEAMIEKLKAGKDVN